jgi:hypothetical protein
VTESQVQRIKDGVESAIKTKARLEEFFGDFLRCLREGDHNTLLLGPVVQGGEGHFGFVHLSGRLHGPSNYDSSYGPTRETVEVLRTALARMATHHCDCDGFIIHRFDDELMMAKMADTLWPGQYTDIVEGITQERDHDR